MTWRRRPKRRWNDRAGWLISVALGLGLALWCVSALNRTISPTLLALSQAQVRNQVASAVTRRVEDTLEREDISYDDMVILQTGAQGRITALTTNTARMNALRGSILNGVLEDLNSLAQEPVLVPLGNLTSWDLLSGWGPGIRVEMLAPSSGEAEFVSDFSDAGVNQTRHRIGLTVTVHVTILLPSGAVEVPISTTVPVAETLILGEVPQQYVSIGTMGE